MKDQYSDDIKFLVIFFIMLVLSIALVIGFVYVASAQEIGFFSTCSGDQCPSVLLRNPQPEKVVSDSEKIIFLENENQKLRSLVSNYARQYDAIRFR